MTPSEALEILAADERRRAQDGGNVVPSQAQWAPWVWMIRELKSERDPVERERMRESIFNALSMAVTLGGPLPPELQSFLAKGLRQMARTNDVDSAFAMKAPKGRPPTDHAKQFAQAAGVHAVMTWFDVSKSAAMALIEALPGRQSWSTFNRNFTAIEERWLLRGPYLVDATGTHANATKEDLANGRTVVVIFVPKADPNGATHTQPLDADLADVRV